MPDPRPLRVFLCHAREDKPVVRELYRQLTAEGWMDVWLDTEKLLPGQNWDIEIEKAVEESDIVIVCLSKQAVTKEGYVQSEQSFVLDIARTKPEETIFVIPLRLDECQVPRRLRTWQYLDYFPKSNRKWAYQRLLESLKLRAAKLGISVLRPSTALRADTLEDEVAKAERERKAKEERDRIAAQKAEAERIAGEKAERERKAKEERDRIARQKAEERRKATADAFRKINFKQILFAGGIIVALLVLCYICTFIVVNLPTSPAPSMTVTPTQTSEVWQTSETFPTITPTIAPPTLTPTPKAGDTMISPKDGMVMVFVPEGEFTMGSDSGSSDEKPVHKVTLDSYWIDQTEVTNVMYAKCVEAGACEPPSSASSYTRNSYYGNPEFDDYPVIYVDWNKASAYCEWAGRRLPTEAEWEKTASWDDKNQKKYVYPWGDSIDCSFTNYWGKDKGCVGDTTKVKTYPTGVSPYGAYDMAGNVLEWVSSLYKPYPYDANDGREDLRASGSRVLRGGSWNYYGYLVRTAVRGGYDPTNADYDFGFRCSRSP